MRAALLALLLAAAASPAGAAERFGSHFAKACGLTGTATSVVADVYDDTSAVDPTPILATIANSDIIRMGSTDCYRVDLATTSAPISYPGPGDPTERHYTIVFRDDAANVIKTTESVAGLVGPKHLSLRCMRETPIYATVVDLTRGISSDLVAGGVVSHIRVEHDCSLVFSSPDFTFYYVLAYDAQKRLASRTPSTTEP